MEKVKLRRYFSDGNGVSTGPRMSSASASGPSKGRIKKSFYPLLNIVQLFFPVLHIIQSSNSSSERKFNVYSESLLLTYDILYERSVRVVEHTW